MGEVDARFQLDAPGVCHCGDPVMWHLYTKPSFTRGMCAACDDVRCDAYPGECGR